MQKPSQNPQNTQGNAQQQNISINISYNLNTHKIPPSIIGPKKKGSKSKKVHVPGLQSIGNQFFSHMAFNPVSEGKKSLKKQNLSKKSNQPGLVAKQTKPSQEKKTSTKKKKPKQVTITEPNIATCEPVIEYYNPLANNSKNFLKRAVQSQDIFKVQHIRKLKTQASNYEPNESTFKKMKRSTTYSKQNPNVPLTKNSKINNFFKDNGFNFVGHKLPPSINTILKKPSIGSSKTPKNRKSSQQIKQKQKRVNTQENQNLTKSNVPQTRHNKSCMLYSTKKQAIITEPNLVESAEHIFSTYASTNSNKLPKQRAHSAYSFSRNGKQLVTKLLNMSLISSELGSSQLISSERMKSGRNDITRKKLGLKVDEFDQYNHYQHNLELSQMEGKTRSRPQGQEAQPGNALRQYLNSIDLRIIKNIEDDTANIATLKEDKVQHPKPKQTQKDKLMLKISNNSKLRNQPQNIEQNQADVVSFYNKLFQNALQNKKIQQEQQKYLDSVNLSSERKSLSIDFNNTAKIKKEHFTIQGFEDQEEQQQHIDQSEHDTQQIYEFVKTHKPEGSRKLNFQHYKDLLNKQAEKDKKDKTDFNFELMNSDNEFDFVPYKRETQDADIKRSIEKLQAVDLHEKVANDLLQNSFKPAESPSSGSSLSHLKEEQVERWNNINKRMNLKISQGIQKQADQEQAEDQDSHLISQGSAEESQQILLFSKQPVKSPKYSNRQKFIASEPEYNQVCWEYNADELTKQIQNYTKQQEPSKRQSVNIHNSPNNCSEDGNGSGDEEYDSKKYSQVTIYKDAVLQDNFLESGRGRLEKQSSNNSLIDSLEEGQEELSYEEKQISSDNRWINRNYQGTFDNIEGRIKKFIHTNENKTQFNNDQNYLDCELSSFGVSNLTLKNHANSHEPVISIQIPKQISSLQAQNRQCLNQTDEEKHQTGEGTFKLTINGKQTKQKITLQASQPAHNIDVFSDIKRKRLTHIVEDIILELIREFAKDISYILKKSSQDKKYSQSQQSTSPFRTYKQHDQNQLSPFSTDPESFEHINPQQSRKQQLKKSQFVGKCFGIDASFMSVQKYLTEFKEYLLKDDNMKKSMVKNINKDIGANSLEILKYLRPQYQTQNQQDDCQDEEGLFVVPSEAFSQFEDYLQQQIEEKNKSLEPQKQIILTQKQKRNTNIWHRGIFESWNQFLDYERPYGINGKPYDWVTEKKKFREVQFDQIDKKLQKGIDRLLQAISLPSGIIFDKYDIPPMYADLSEEQKMYLNDERLCRMLAVELFESEETWINYNDEMAELLVELSRMIEERLYFEMATQLKNAMRRRKTTRKSAQISTLFESIQSGKTQAMRIRTIRETEEKWLIEQNINRSARQMRATIQIQQTLSISLMVDGMDEQV